MWLRCMHSKYAGWRSLDGSYNLDPRSDKLISETAMVFLEPALSQQLRTASFDNDLKYSREVTTDMAAEFEAPEDMIRRYTSRSENCSKNSYETVLLRYKTAVAIITNTSIATRANKACSQCSVCLPCDGLLLTRMAHLLFLSDHS